MDKKINAILIHSNDNVVTAIESLHTGSIVRYRKGREMEEIIIIEEIPKFHKIAFTPVAVVVFTINLPGGQAP